MKKVFQWNRRNRPEHSNQGNFIIEGTKVVFSGDIHQIDHPYLDKRSNGLTYLISRMKGQDVFAHITLEKGERSELAELASNLL